MVCVNKSLEAMLYEIENPIKVISNEVFPKTYYSTTPDSFLKQNEFFWLWQYGRQLSDALRKLHLPIKLRFGMGTQTPIQSAIENAYDYAAGDGRVTRYGEWPIKVEVYVGNNGIVFTVTDSGKGFDFNAVVEQNRKKQKLPDVPRGFDVYDAPFDSSGVPYEVSCEGNRINIMYSFQRKPLSILAPTVPKKNK